jgi:hypothetical protein
LTYSLFTNEKWRVLPLLGVTYFRRSITVLDSFLVSAVLEPHLGAEVDFLFTKEISVSLRSTLVYSSDEYYL